jgi:8-oxo-dGTP diphosphatase
MTETDSAAAVDGEYVLPAVPVSAGALIFDQAGGLLILKPTYKSGWTIPGGVMEADGETPWQACRREVREETALDVTRGRLVCMDFRLPRAGNPGGIRYLFDCGDVPDSATTVIRVQAEEVAAYRFVPMAEALALLRRPIRRRVRAVRTRAGKPRGRGIAYLENGRPVPAVKPPGRSGK